jgi:hypothetical protein
MVVLTLAPDADMLLDNGILGENFPKHVKIYENHSLLILMTKENRELYTNRVLSKLNFE